jgi:hypothetical protein
VIDIRTTSRFVNKEKDIFSLGDMAVKRTNPFKYCESVPDSGQVTASSLSYYGVSRPLGPWKFLATQVAGEIWE